MDRSMEGKTLYNISKEKRKVYPLVRYQLKEANK